MSFIISFISSVLSGLVVALFAFWLNRKNK
ncbi:type I toxin-antitoxin system Fst family toxin [Lactococcus petauri]